MGSRDGRRRHLVYIRLIQRWNQAKAYWDRPAAFGSVLVSYLGIFLVAATLGGAALYNDATSTRDLCGVVSNVHDQAVRDYDNEYEDLLREVSAYEQTLDYLKETDPKEAPSLYRRIQDNLPQVLARVNSAQESVENQRLAIAATSPPSVCRINYLKG
jgi:hypothetical protein